MTPEVAQRLVHELPGWDRSIDEARSMLGYDPAWGTPDALDWDGSPPEPLLSIWFATRRRAFHEAVENATVSLGLWEGFGAYWRACFLTYRQGDLSSVVEREPLLGRVGMRRAYPPRESMLSVTLKMNDTGNRLTITGPAEFVTDATLREASKRARHLVERAQIDRHPLLGRRRSRAGQMARGQDDPRKARALALSAGGLPTHRIVTELELEYGDPPAKSTVIRWLAAERFARRT